MKLNKLLIGSTLLLSSSHVFAGAFWGPANPGENPATLESGASITRVSVDASNTQLRTSDSTFLSSDWPVVSKNGVYTGFVSVSTTQSSNSLKIQNVRLYIKNNSNRSLRLVESYTAANNWDSLTRIVDVSNDGNKVILSTKRALTPRAKANRVNFYLRNLSNNSTKLLDSFSQASYAYHFNNGAGVDNQSVRFSDDESAVLKIEQTSSTTGTFKVISITNNQPRLSFYKQLSFIEDSSNDKANLELHDFANNKALISIRTGCPGATAVNTSPTALCVLNLSNGQITPVASMVMDFNMGEKTAMPINAVFAKFSNNAQSVVFSQSTKAGVIFAGVPVDAENLSYLRDYYYKNLLSDAESTPANANLNQHMQLNRFILPVVFEKRITSPKYSVKHLGSFDFSSSANKEMFYTHLRSFKLSDDNKYAAFKLDYKSPFNYLAESELLVYGLDSNKFNRIPLGIKNLYTVPQFQKDGQSVFFNATSNNLVNNDNNYTVQRSGNSASFYNAADIFSLNLSNN